MQFGICDIKGIETGTINPDKHLVVYSNKNEKGKDLKEDTREVDTLIISIIIVEMKVFGYKIILKRIILRRQLKCIGKKI